MEATFYAAPCLWRLSSTQLLGDEDPEEAPLLGSEEGGNLILQVEQGLSVLS